MAITNISDVPGFSPVETQSAVPVVPVETGSSPVAPTGEGAFAPRVSSPVPGEILQVQASNLSPQAQESPLAQIGDVLSGALTGAEATTENAVVEAPVDLQRGPASGSNPSPAPVAPPVTIDAPVGSVEMPAPPAVPGATPKPAPTYVSVLSPMMSPKVDPGVDIPAAAAITVETPRGTYNSVLPAMAGATGGGTPRTMQAYLTRNDSVTPNAAPAVGVPTTPAFTQYHESIKGKANFFSSGRNQPPPGDPASNTWQAANISRFEIPLEGGKSQGVRVFGPAAGAFEGFLTELKASGYPIYNIGSQVVRNKRNSTSLSEHSYGTAIDINGETAPGEAGPRNAFDNKLITDLPANISQMAAKYGLSWGGDWKGKKDAMHFEYTGTTPSGG